MLNFSYSNPVTIHFGSDALEKLPQEIKKYGNRVLLVYGGDSLKSSGNYEKITAVLTKNQISYVDFGGNVTPAYSKVLEAVKICKVEAVDVVVGIGGSVCMDMAKIIAFGAKNDNLWDYLSGELSPNDKEMLPVGEIPTFPSGGSEVDAAAEIEDHESGARGSLYGKYPSFAILNPELTYSVNQKETAYGALVTFAQLFSNYFGGNSKIAEGFCETVMRTVLDSMPVVLNDPKHYEARADLMWASAVNTFGMLRCGKESAWSLYGCETIAEELFHVNYRQAVAVIFPKWLKAMGYHYSNQVYNYAVNVMDVNPSAKSKTEVIEEGIAITESVYKQYGIAVTFNEIAEVPEKEVILEALKEFEDDDILTREEVKDIILRCIL
ncbi:iron-containing alcohol dehydrogenase [Clostridium fungisolvens]|uniref:Long-chain-alcohol dehydrogenase 2 n=1 Tax=Clostridium fungisolvens TaxID=1604897 RepID=A0A6V8SBV4_9CLOT|nr:iron-containing alcohol dehydrogenase [Clostridium fungisolvens]GFP74540.1 Long-chain-alcohol dehydrogenase 2 [Clostridium fungisolvens]